MSSLTLPKALNTKLKIVPHYHLFRLCIENSIQRGKHNRPSTFAIPFEQYHGKTDYYQSMNLSSVIGSKHKHILWVSPSTLATDSIVWGKRGKTKTRSHRGVILILFVQVSLVKRCRK